MLIQRFFSIQPLAWALGPDLASHWDAGQLAVPGAPALAPKGPREDQLVSSHFCFQDCFPCSLGEQKALDWQFF